MYSSTSHKHCQPNCRLKVDGTSRTPHACLCSLLGFILIGFRNFPKYTNSTLEYSCTFHQMFVKSNPLVMKSDLWLSILAGHFIESRWLISPVFSFPYLLLSRCPLQDSYLHVTIPDLTVKWSVKSLTNAWVPWKCILKSCRENCVPLSSKQLNWSLWLTIRRCLCTIQNSRNRKVWFKISVSNVFPQIQPSNCIQQVLWACSWNQFHCNSFNLFRQIMYA